VQGDVLELGSCLELSAAEPLIADAFAAQRRRLLRTARTFTDAEWGSPTRCTEWDVREVILHVIGATDACRETLTGERPVFEEDFDPNASPDAFVRGRAGEPIERTLRSLDDAIDSAIDEIVTQRAARSASQVTAVWGRPIDWRLFVTHMFWDGWIHERDVLTTLGREPELADSETRLAAAYGLHTAGIVAGLFGVPLDATLVLEGSGGGTFRIVVDGLDVRITVTPLAARAGALNGDVVEVTDALAGREPLLDTVLDAPPELVTALSGVSDFLRG